MLCYLDKRFCNQPQRIQLKRTKGWRMPENTVKVDRTTKWGNSFVTGKENPFIPGAMVQDRRHAFVLYRSFVQYNDKLIIAARMQLSGKKFSVLVPYSS